MSPKIATSDMVGREELLDFVRSRHQVVLITTKQDGAPQVSPVTAGPVQAGCHGGNLRGSILLCGDQHYLVAAPDEVEQLLAPDHVRRSDLGAHRAIRMTPILTSARPGARPL